MFRRDCSFVCIIFVIAPMSLLPAYRYRGGTKLCEFMRHGVNVIHTKFLPFAIGTSLGENI